MGAVRHASRVLALAALVACAPDLLAPLPPEVAGRTLLLATVSEGVVQELRPFAPGRLASEGASLVLLAFEAPLDAFTGPLVEGAVRLMPAGASPDEAWTLPATRGAWSLAGEAIEPISAPTWLSTLQVARPPCPSARWRNIEGLPASSGTRTAIVRGREAWLFLDPNDGERARVYRAALPDGPAVWLDSLAPVAAACSPYAYLDGELLWVVWGTDGSHEELRALDADGRVVATKTPTTVPLELQGLAGRGDDVVARLRTGALVRLDPASGRWQRLRAAPGHNECDTRVRSQILEILGPGRALANVEGGPIVELDLSAPDAPRGAALVDRIEACRSARTTLASGVELLAHESLTEQRAHVLWRRPGLGFEELSFDANASGRAVGAVGDLALVAGENNVLLLFEYVPARPELPPRYCGVVETAGTGVLQIVPLDERTALLSGLAGRSAGFLDIFF